MKKTIIGICVLLVLVFAFAPTSFGWFGGSAKDIKVGLIEISSYQIKINQKVKEYRQGLVEESRNNPAVREALKKLKKVEEIKNKMVQINDKEEISLLNKELRELMKDPEIAEAMKAVHLSSKKQMEIEKKVKQKNSELSMKMVDRLKIFAEEKAKDEGYGIVLGIAGQAEVGPLYFILYSNVDMKIIEPL